jgi:hypothetical protein
VLGITIDDARKQLFSFGSDNIIQRLSPRKIEKIVREIEYADHSYILDDCVSIDDCPSGILERAYHEKLVTFVRDRHIPSNTSIFIAYKGEYKDRIILPIYQNGQLVYFQGRSLDPGEPRKYKNPTLSKGSIIYNRDVFNKDKPIVIVEGLIDAMQLGTQGTSALGASISDSFLKTVISCTNSDVILALDNDSTGQKEMKRVLEKSRFSGQLKFFLFTLHKYSRPYKDLGEMSLHTTIDLYDFVVSNAIPKFEALLHMGGTSKSNEDNDHRKGLHRDKRTKPGRPNTTNNTTNTSYKDVIRQSFEAVY